MLCVLIILTCMMTHLLIGEDVKDTTGWPLTPFKGILII